MRRLQDRAQPVPESHRHSGECPPSTPRSTKVQISSIRHNSVPGLMYPKQMYFIGESAPNTARAFIEFQLGLRLHARN
jgi:hypothetical protein